MMELAAKVASFPIVQARQKEVAVYKVLRDTSAAGLALVSIVPVSYTHLTLPTICSV